MRTTIDIDTVLLKELKQLQKKEERTLTELVNGLLSFALNNRRQAAPRKKKFRVKTYNMGKALIDLEDKEAVSALYLDEYKP